MAAKVLTVRDVMWLPPAEGLLPNLDKPLRRGLEILLMAGSKSNYLAKKVLEEYFGGVTFTAAGHNYLRLWTGSLDDTSTGSASNEATYGSYAATEIGTANNQTDAWNAGSGTTTVTVTNKNAITCPTSSGTTNTIIYVSVGDATSGGNLYVWASVSSTVISNGDTPKVNAGSLSVVED